MYDRGSKSYLQARALKKGERRLAPEHQVIVDWISSTWDVRCLDFAFARKEVSKSYREQLVYVILETLQDCSRLETAKAGASLAERFLAYFRAPPDAGRRKDTTKTDVYPVDAAGRFPPIVLPFCSLENIETGIANARCRSDVELIAEKYKDRIDSISTNNGCDHTVWFATDEQASRALATGLTQAIRDDLLAALKRYDEFGYFGPHSISLRFDSRQTLERDHGGELWKYYR